MVNVMKLILWLQGVWQEACVSSVVNTLKKVMLLSTRTIFNEQLQFCCWQNDTVTCTVLNSATIVWGHKTCTYLCWTSKSCPEQTCGIHTLCTVDMLRFWNKIAWWKMTDDSWKKQTTTPCRVTKSAVSLTVTLNSGLVGAEIWMALYRLVSVVTCALKSWWKPGPAQADMKHVCILLWLTCFSLLFVQIE